MLQRDAQIRGLEFLPDLQSNAAFSDDEHRCLLQALLNGTLQPDLYRGRMLPIALIDSLQLHVDDMTNRYMQFATTQQDNPQSEFYQQRTDDQPISMYANAIQSDVILHTTTGAYTTQQEWYQGFLEYIHDRYCPEPSIIVRALLRNDPHHASMSPNEANARVLSTMATHKKHRKHHKVKDSDQPMLSWSLSTSLDLINQSPHPYFGNNHGYDPNPLTPLRNLANRIQAFLAVMDTSPQRLQHSPDVRNTSFQDATAQTSIHMGNSSGQPLHHLSPADIDMQRQAFNVNVHDHYLRFPQINTSSSSQASNQPIVSGIKATTDDDVHDQQSDMSVPQTRYMDAETMELIPRRDTLPTYEDNSPEARELRYKCTIARLEHLCGAIRGYNSNSGNFSKADFTKKRKVVHARNTSPPTAPTLLQMVSRTDQQTGYSVSSQSPSTTPESIRSRQSNTIDLRDIRTAPRTEPVPTPHEGPSVHRDNNDPPSPTNDENRG